MRKLVFAFIICFFSTQVYFAQEAIGLDEEYIDNSEINLNWMPTYKEALKKSRKEKKPLLIYFTGSDWCGPCKVLDKDLFHTEKFKSLADKNLILLEVDIPRRLDVISLDKMKENKILQKKYSVKSFPTLMIVNHRGKKIAEKKGYIITEYYYPFFESQINKY
tara:strand:+ start:8774 stop:9262 length:489 start_codon:yes stop_codon:yes gene_type:complete